MITETIQSDLIGMMFTKVCRSCNVEKTSDEFYSHKETLDRLRNECKECWNKQSLKYYFANKETLNMKRRKKHFERNYNLTTEELESLKDKQENKCLVCSSVGDLVVDHNHKTGKIRGLLCNRCNLAVGFIENNPGWAPKAVAYLERTDDHRDYTVGTNWYQTH